MQVGSAGTDLDLRVVYDQDEAPVDWDAVILRFLVRLDERLKQSPAAPAEAPAADSADLNPER